MKNGLAASRQIPINPWSSAFGPQMEVHAVASGQGDRVWCRPWSEGCWPATRLSWKNIDRYNIRESARRRTSSKHFLLAALGGAAASRSPQGSPGELCLQISNQTNMSTTRWKPVCFGLRFYKKLRACPVGISCSGLCCLLIQLGLSIHRMRRVTFTVRTFDSHSGKTKENPFRHFNTTCMFWTSEIAVPTPCQPLQQL